MVDMWGQCNYAPHGYQSPLQHQMDQHTTPMANDPATWKCWPAPNQAPLWASLITISRHPNHDWAPPFHNTTLFSRVLFKFNIAFMSPPLRWAASTTKYEQLNLVLSHSMMSNDPTGTQPNHVPPCHHTLLKKAPNLPTIKAIWIKRPPNTSFKLNAPIICQKWQNLF